MTTAKLYAGIFIYITFIYYLSSRQSVKSVLFLR